jgi:branched-chain amino acid transport system substrate-binding protein
VTARHDSLPGLPILISLLSIAPKEFLGRLSMTSGRIARSAVTLSFFCASWLIGASQVSAADPYDLNVILSLTGGASFLGKAEQQSLQLAEKWANENGGIQGRPLHLVFHDDQSTPQVAVQLASQVVAGKPAVEIGANLVAMCNAMRR